MEKDPWPCIFMTAALMDSAKVPATEGFGGLCTSAPETAAPSNVSPSARLQVEIQTLKPARAAPPGKPSRLTAALRSIYPKDPE